MKYLWPPLWFKFIIVCISVQISTMPNSLRIQLAAYMIHYTNRDLKRMQIESSFFPNGNAFCKIKFHSEATREHNATTCYWICFKISGWRDFFFVYTTVKYKHGNLLFWMKFKNSFMHKTWRYVLVSVRMTSAWFLLKKNKIVHFNARMACIFTRYLSC